jgi:ParB family transcriptional regulator, chromosome partitioning protein
VTLTKAAALAIAKEPELAFSIGLAALMTTSTLSREVKLECNGLGQQDIEEELEFEDALEHVRKRAPKDRMKLFAEIVGLALDFRTWNGSHGSMDADSFEGDPSHAALICNAIDPAAMKAALIGLFDAEDYFESVPRAMCLAALEEMKIGETGLKQLAGAKKADVAKAAAEAARKQGWLPIELRTAHYDGPAKGAPKKTPAKRGAKTTKRRKAA